MQKQIRTVPPERFTRFYAILRASGTLDALVAPYGFGWNLRGILPKVLPAGACAGYLTAEGEQQGYESWAVFDAIDGSLIDSVFN